MVNFQSPNNIRIEAFNVCRLKLGPIIKAPNFLAAELFM